MGNRRLEKDGAALPLKPEVFDTLVRLVRAFPHPVGREPGATLAGNIDALRTALGLREDGSPYLEEVPGPGYRFTVEPAAASAGGNRRKRLAAGTTLLALALALVLAGWWRSRPHEPRLEAVRRYRQGMAIWRQRAAAEEAEHEFREAVRIDPKYADAHAGLAAALASRGYPAAGAEQEAARALALDPRSSLAYAARGFVQMAYKWDWIGAERNLSRAVAMNPADSAAARWYALLLTLRGHAEEGLWQMDRVLARSPASANLLAERCDLLYFDRLYRDAIQSCEAALRADAGLTAARERLVYLYASTGDWETAVERALGADSGGTDAQRGEWQQRFRKAMRRKDPSGFWRTLAELFREQGSGPYEMAIAEAQLEDRAAALDDLERAVARHDFPVFCLGAEPALADLHSEPRFQAVCRTVGVPCN